MFSLIGARIRDHCNSGEISLISSFLVQSHRIWRVRVPFSLNTTDTLILGHMRYDTFGYDYCHVKRPTQIKMLSKNSPQILLII